MDYEFRQIRRETLPDLTGIFASAFGHSLPMDVIEAKHSTEFTGLRDLGFTAYTPEGQAAAFYGIFPLRLRIGGRSHLASQSGDTMVRKEHEGRRLFVRLAKATYADAAEKGVKAVYGFPLATSYHGLVRSLGWTHHGNFRRYQFFAPTLPVSDLLWRYPFARRILRGWQNLLLKLFPRGRYFPGKLMESGQDCVDRSEDFWRYKFGVSDVKVLRIKGVNVIVKLEGCLGIGDVDTNDPRLLKAILRRLRLFCFFAGIARMRTYVSPGSPLDQALETFATPSEALAICYLDLSDDVSARNVRYCYFDMDTF